MLSESNRPLTRCAVLGSPIQHSLSPVLHAAAYAHLGLTDWHYGRHQVSEDQLSEFLAGLGPQWRGLSLTMPLKSAVLGLAEADELSRRIGAANTLLLDRSGARTAHNTDAPGVAAALRTAGLARIERALVLGSGSTARSVVAGLATLGVRQVTVLARTPERARPLQDLAAGLDVGLDVIDWSTVHRSTDLPTVDLAVQTAVARAADPIADLVVEQCRAVFDVIYDPWPTRLAERAIDAGLTVLDGLELLVHQAALQVELMTGATVPPAVLLSAGRAALLGPAEA